MFRKRKSLRKDLPVIDISRKQAKGLFGRTKLLPTTKREQRKKSEVDGAISRQILCR